MLNNLPAPRLDRWIYFFIILHIIAWTLAPLLIRYALPMDALEGTVWGHQLEWGYDKNPYVNGWLTALAIKLNPSGYLIYFFSQLSVGLCFLALWNFGKKILPPIYAFIAVLILECMQYYNLHAIDLNDNTLELGLWAATILFFYQALTENKIHHWILTGVFAGLSLMTKYYAVVLFLPMLLFLLSYPQNRVQFKKFPLYLALFIFLIISVPHFIWLFSHDFVTVHYALGRVRSLPSFWNHLSYPAQFTWQQLEVFLPAFLVMLIFFGKKRVFAINSEIPSFAKNYLLTVSMGPFLVTVILSLLTGIQLRAGWGQPLLTFWGLTFLVWYLPEITQKRFTVFLTTIGIFFAGTLFAYSIALIQASQPSSANFPGKNIATNLTSEWNLRFHTPLQYVVGPRWLAGNIAFYSENHPFVYIDANPILSPWIKEENIKKYGAIFVWDPTEAQQIPFDRLKSRFHNLEPTRTLHFAWMRNKKMLPVLISIAFLPPSDSRPTKLLNKA